jgi:hypothetical protein
MADRQIKIPGPDHPITIEKNPNRVVISFGGQVLADTSNALTMGEAKYKRRGRGEEMEERGLRRSSPLGTSEDGRVLSRPLDKPGCNSFCAIGHTTLSMMPGCLRQGTQRCRRGVGDVRVRLLAQASDAYRAHDFARYAYRHAAAQRRDVGGDERRSTLVDVVLDLRRRSL